MDEKKNSGDGGDLKARLKLGGRSLRSKAREEEKKREEVAREAEAAEEEDEFSLVKRFGTRTHANLVLSQEELAALERPPAEGRGKRSLVVVLIALIALGATLAAGYFLGKAFGGRKLENLKIDEAKLIIKYVEEDRKEYFEAIAAHRERIADLVEKFKRPNLDPKFQLRELYSFMDHCDDFLQRHKPVTARDLFPREIFNSEAIPQVMAFAESINVMFLLTAKMTDERKLLQIVGTGDPDEGENPEPLMATLIYEPDPQGDIKVPWNKGEFVQLMGEIKLGDSSRGSDPTYVVPVKKAESPDPVDVNTSRVVEVDAWPVIRRQAGLYRLALLGRVKGSLADLHGAAERVRWDNLKKQLLKWAEKDHYFVL